MIAYIQDARARRQLADAHIRRRGRRWWVAFKIGAPHGDGIANPAAARMLYDVEPEWRYA